MKGKFIFLKWDPSMPGFNKVIIDPRRNGWYPKYLVSENLILIIPLLAVIRT